MTDARTPSGSSGCRACDAVGELHRCFRVAAPARSRYGFRDDSFGLAGRVLLIDHAEAERISGAINAGRDLALRPDMRVLPGMLAAAALLHELMHAIMVLYGMGAVATHGMETALGGPATDAALDRFLTRFPGMTPATPVAADNTDPDQRSAAGEEVVIHGLALDNRALTALHELFEPGELLADDEFLRGRQAAFAALSGAGTTTGRRVEQIGDARGAAAGMASPSLLDILTEPQRRHPDSLFDQLQAALDLWGEALGERFGWLLVRAQRGLDQLREERPGRSHFSGPPPRPQVGYAGSEGDGPPEFSVDREWMPQVALVAKNAFVWLAQLSTENGRTITRLDQVPDEALDTLAADGFNALWLVGVWRRSEASRTIKRLRGQPFAEASAYAIADYAVAPELGGEEALDELRTRAWQRGIRLASDMVPNHTGLDARWVVEHPERFLQLEAPPFAGYSFGGADVSSDPRIEVRIEDGYYDGSDAAVVYQVREKDSGRVRYVYHGNDGTLMPWNDTAQLDYLRADVREAVVETILEVAGRFPIIRFDAAMTLVRRHIRRLWHPEPGQGGAIASRSRYAMAASAFDAAMPREFWRDVVEAVALRAPDTLLLAEAFWLMESYFVRNLGMHRVYNSAFMHMLGDEDNAGYRQLVRETLAFDARILERFVNYLTNPDEESARERFGSGDKYFGAATVLATTPGLPMFGHGQVAGLSEKYGMEFRAPRLDEAGDRMLAERHRREIAPLLRDRAAFASSARFRLFTMTDDDGAEVADVIAYGFAATENDSAAGGIGDGASLVVFNNSPHRREGRLAGCEPFSAAGGDVTHGQQLLAALRLGVGQDGALAAFSHPNGDVVTWPARDVAATGLWFTLQPYQYLVYRGVHLTDAVRAPAVLASGAEVDSVGRRRMARRSSLLAGQVGRGARRAAAVRRRG